MNRHKNSTSHLITCLLSLLVIGCIYGRHVEAQEVLSTHFKNILGSEQTRHMPDLLRQGENDETNPPLLRKGESWKRIVAINWQYTGMAFMIVNVKTGAVRWTKTQDCSKSEAGSALYKMGDEITIRALVSTWGLTIVGTDQRGRSIGWDKGLGRDFEIYTFFDPTAPSRHVTN